MNAHVSKLGDVTLSVLPPVARFNLRIAPDDLKAASGAFGLELPTGVGQGAHKGSRSAWCMGPDEWLLHAPEAQQDAIETAFAGIRQTAAHSLVVISDREITYGLSGPRATELLTTGCPIDLSRIAVGNAKRTVFDYAQVVLIRDGETDWRLEVWRSFAPHVEALLSTAQHEFESGF
ncbi:sarcosine oxidase subunit gamma [Paracoccus tegillarcae]|uniref:Sarcosine oxidase subunit gamma n=1 Tax=Paracoccus tegillarcae TaxID=1529068 RepID=A0A2K9EGZ1_9RHOB|nr:sarcosine oxidase subunit gamma family protein [Paracoccus tegillarcae]AUH34223.1 sarcosine oxidase subunit gamma [Paracoccus tegillarcae]